MSSYMQKWMDNYREKRRIKKIKNKKKRRKQNRLRRALKDNKITKKEARKLAKAGVKRKGIERYAKKRQKRRVKNISSRWAAKNPAGVDRIKLGYEDPLVSKGAEKTFNNYKKKKRKVKKISSVTKPTTTKPPKINEVKPITDPKPDPGLEQFDPVNPTNRSVIQNPISIANPRSLFRGGIGQFGGGFNAAAAMPKISSKLINF